MVPTRTASLTFNNSTFCPHSVFMCFVWIWEQTAIISLHNNNWLVFLTETECVYCAVRTGCTYITQATLLLFSPSPVPFSSWWTISHWDRIFADSSGFPPQYHLQLHAAAVLCCASRMNAKSMWRLCFFSCQCEYILLYSMLKSHILLQRMLLLHTSWRN